MNYGKTFQNIQNEFNDFFDNIDFYLDNDSEYYSKSFELQSKLSLLIKEIYRSSESNSNKNLIEEILSFWGDFVGTGEDYEISVKILDNLLEQGFISEPQLRIFYNNLSTRQG